MKKITILFGALLLLTQLAAQKIQFSQTNWAGVLAEAKATNKAIFVDAYTDWCAPCKKMDKTVFTDASVIAFYDANFISLKLDMEKGEGESFAKRYDVRAFPTLLYFSPEGELTHRAVGFKDAATFLELGKVALDPDARLGALTQRYAAGERSPEFLKNYAYAAKNAIDPKYPEVAAAYLETQNEWSSPETMRFIFEFTESTSSRQFGYLIENRAMFEQELGSSVVFNRVQEIVEKRLDFIMGQKGDATADLQEAKQLFDKVYKEEATYKFAAFKMMYSRTKGDREGFAEAAVEYVNNTTNITSDELNSIARTFAEVIENKVMLEKAVEWSKRAIRMEDTYEYHYTLAALYFKLENKSKAKKEAGAALKMCKKLGEDTTAIEDLLKQIKAGK